MEPAADGMAEAGAARVDPAPQLPQAAEPDVPAEVQDVPKSVAPSAEAHEGAVMIEMSNAVGPGGHQVAEADLAAGAGAGAEADPRNTTYAKACYKEHLGSSRQYMRDMILGVNDGLVSIFLLVVGVVGGNLSTSQVLLAGLTGAVAGAISMALGEFMATKSQTEVMEAELKLERKHLETNRPAEVAELKSWLAQLGLKGDVLDQATEQVCMAEDTMLEAMKIFEFGMVDTEQRSAIVAMLTSGAVFIVGSLPAWVPFGIAQNNRDGLIASAVLSAAGLFVVGVIKTSMTRGNWLMAGLENTAIGLAGAGVSFLVGLAYSGGNSGV